MATSIKILYEDKDVLVINKPSGLVVHSDGRTTEPTLADWILEKYPGMKNVGEPLQLKTMNNKLETVYRPGIVHRIDRETSGVLVVAKNQDAFLFLKKQFQDREVEKSYRAFVYGELKQDEGVIARPIARSRKDFRMWSAQRGARGAEREAITEYKTLGRIPAATGGRGGSDGFSFLDVRPKTGRTHQIRVHLKAINHPVVCDKLYAPGLSKSEAIGDKPQSRGTPKRDCALGFTRLALHAFSIAFKLPSGKRMKVEAPYPGDFELALKFFSLNSL